MRRLGWIKTLSIWLLGVVLLMYAAQWLYVLVGSKEVKPTAKHLAPLVDAMRAGDPKLGRYVHLREGIASGCNLWQFDLLLGHDCLLVTVHIPSGELVNGLDQLVSAVSRPCDHSSSLSAEGRKYFGCLDGVHPKTYFVKIMLFEFTERQTPGRATSNEAALVRSIEAEGRKA